MPIKAMKILGIIMLITGVCIAVPGIIGAIASDYDTASIFGICYLFGTLIGLGSIPLLIVSGVRSRNAANKNAKTEVYGYCSKCGSPKRYGDVFCSKCGASLK